VTQRGQQLPELRRGRRRVRCWLSGPAPPTRTRWGVPMCKSHGSLPGLGGRFLSQESRLWLAGHVCDSGRPANAQRVQQWVMQRHYVGSGCLLGGDAACEWQFASWKWRSAAPIGNGGPWGSSHQGSAIAGSGKWMAMAIAGRRVEGSKACRRQCQEGIEGTRVPDAQPT
jgi:hypothetical protein